MLYDESPGKSLWRPRHPGVVVLDTIGIATSLYWLKESKHWTVDIYVVTVTLLYSVSNLYHYVRYRDWLAKADHIMIFYVIAVTALPYWGMLMPFKWYPGGPLLILGICLLGTVVKIVHFLPRVISGLVYVVAAIPMIAYFIIKQEMVPTLLRFLWLLGVFLYGIQLIVYTLKRPDPYPERYGYREVQHLVLLIATNLHCFVAISLTK